MEYRIEPSGRLNYPFETMEVGDSFVFPIGKRLSVQTLCSYHKRTSGKVYQVKKISSQEARCQRLV